MKKTFVTLFSSLMGLVCSVGGQTSPQESDFYQIESYSIPEPLVLEVGAIEALPGGKLAVSTRRGEIYFVENAFDPDPSKVTYHLYAEGLHEVLGLAWKDDWLYITQRPEVSRLKDVDGDGRADLFETVSDGWSISGDYHEYAFGSRFDPEGNLYVVLCLTGSFNSKVPYRGWCLKITPDGKCIPFTAGIRSPGGIGFSPDGTIYYDDNQGIWNGSSSLKPIYQGVTHGEVESLKWWNVEQMGEKPLPSAEKTRIVQERARNPKFVPPAVVLPHGKVGNSPTGWDWDATGKFGPFRDQLMIADQTFSNLNRVYLEKVNGVAQGVVFPFLSGFKSGGTAVRMVQEEGTLLVGGSDRGWGAKGGKPFHFERVRWTGKVPFEVLKMSALSDGFELEFTESIDPESTKSQNAIQGKAFTYIWQSSYGSPEVDVVNPEIQVTEISEDRKKVKIKVTPLTKGHVHEFDFKGIRSQAGNPLLHSMAWYTLNEIP